MTTARRVRFGRLEVIEQVGPMVVCRCDCGTRIVAWRNNVVTGDTRSCGCLRKEVSSKRLRDTQLTHGESSTRKQSPTPEYAAWNRMHARCSNPNTQMYLHYGGRGIKVCKRWSRYENFLADMGRKPSPEHSLDRIRNNGNYTPSNCRWATVLEQQNNRRTPTEIKAGKPRRKS